jgi:hypothetical protein
VGFSLACGGNLVLVHLRDCCLGAASSLRRLGHDHTLPLPTAPAARVPAPLPVRRRCHTPSPRNPDTISSPRPAVSPHRYPCPVAAPPPSLLSPELLPLPSSTTRRNTTIGPSHVRCTRAAPLLWLSLLPMMVALPSSTPRQPLYPGSNPPLYGCIRAAAWPEPSSSS